MRTTIAVLQSGLLHGYTVLATDTTLPGASSTAPACTRHPRRTVRVAPSEGADQHSGQRGVGGVVGAKAAGRRIGARSDMPTIYRAPRHTLRIHLFQNTQQMVTDPTIRSCSRRRPLSSG